MNIKIITIALFTSLASACSYLPFTQNESGALCANDQGNFDQCQNMPAKATNKPTVSKLFNTELHFNNLSEYTEQMAAALRNDLRNQSIKQSIVVASFVYLDDTLQNTDQLGMQLAESFINDLQQIGLPVSDHKLTGEFIVNNKGDFIFSRDMEQIYNNHEIGYVLAGTMQTNKRGLIVNARLINYKNKTVVASTSKFLPKIMITGLN